MASDTAARIAGAARVILVAEGAPAVSMRRVAEAAGITPMAIYRHYPNREALLRTLADESSRELAEKWGKRARGRGWEGRILGLLRDFLDFALGTPHLYTFLATEPWEETHRSSATYRDRTAPAYARVIEAVEAGMREGVLREDDPTEVALTITATAQGLVQLYLGGRLALSEKDFRALCERATHRILTGLKP
jgi:AcrR family transcriptional regulator